VDIDIPWAPDEPEVRKPDNHVVQVAGVRLRSQFEVDAACGTRYIAADFDFARDALGSEVRVGFDRNALAKELIAEAWWTERTAVRDPDSRPVNGIEERRVMARAPRAADPVSVGADREVEPDVRRTRAARRKRSQPGSEVDSHICSCDGRSGQGLTVDSLVLEIQTTTDGSK
jgi:hypothetical protein